MERFLLSGRIFIVASGVCLLAIILVIVLLDENSYEIIISALAVLMAYLLKVGVQLRADSVKQACKFIEERRSDGPFREAADKTWHLMVDSSQNSDKAIAKGTINADAVDISRVADVYEEMAILIKHGHADESVLFDYFGNPLVRFFAGYKNDILAFRQVKVHLPSGEQFSSEDEYIELEWLFKRWLCRLAR